MSVSSANDKEAGQADVQAIGKDQVIVLLVSVCVALSVTILTPSIANTHALTLLSVVSEVCHISKLQAGLTENTEVPLCNTSIVLEVHKLSTISAVQLAQAVACLILTTQFVGDALAVQFE